MEGPDKLASRRPMHEQLMRAVRSARERGHEALDEPSGKEILEAAGIRVPRSVVVDVGIDMRSAIADLKPPLVLKVVATGVVHKSDVGGVKLNLRTAEEAATAAAELLQMLRARHVEPQAWLVEEMAPRGVEVVVGGTMDPEFGPLVMVGLGGIFVEVLEDVSFRICPIDPIDAREMLAELKGAPLLGGARGGQGADLDSIVQVLLRVGGEDGLLIACAGEVAELDINPLIVSSDAAIAVDARFILQRRA
jgi:succinyl-CoA synthetase beta subunit